MSDSSGGSTGGGGASKVLREYLIRLRYDIQKNTKEKVERSVKSTENHIKTSTANVVKTLKMFSLAATGIEATAAAWVAAVTKMAESLDDLYFASMRTGASVGNIQSLSYAARQMGVSFGETRSAIESVAAFLRDTPGGGSLLRSIGIDPSQDPTKILQQFGRVTKGMPFYRAHMYGQMLGLDDNTIMALQRGTGRFSADYARMQRQAGVDPQAAAGAGNQVLTSIRGLEAAFNILRQKIVQTFGPGIAAHIQDFRKLLVANFNIITGIIKLASDTLLGISAVITRLVMSAISLVQELTVRFEGMPKTFKMAAEGVAALGVVWFAFSRGYIASMRAMLVASLTNPLAWIAALGVAILALYDDYKVWQRGGKSLIPWPLWLAEIHKAEAGILAFWNQVKAWFQAALKDNRYYIRSIVELFDISEQFATSKKTWNAIVNFFTYVFGAISRIASDSWKYTIKPVFDGITGAIAMIANSWIGKKLGLTFHAAMMTGGAVGAGIDNALGAASGDTAKMLPHGKPASALQRNANLQASIAFWMKQGYTRDQALGLAGNEAQESSGDPNANNGSHGGIFQWSQARRDAILRATGIDVWRASHADQLKAAAWELSAGGSESAAGAAIRSAQGIDAASDAVGKHYERFSGGETAAQAQADYEARRDNAHRLGGVPLPVGVPTGGGRNITINQHNETHITETKNPQGTAQAVDKVNQKNSNNWALRISQGSAM